MSRPIGEWMRFGERGISSDAIASAALCDRRILGNKDHPYDPSDFRRCQLMLEWTGVNLSKYVIPDTKWARLAERWDEIHAACESDVPDYLTTGRGAAPTAYALMKQILWGES